jgi:hypothetical protein
MYSDDDCYSEEYDTNSEDENYKHEVMEIESCIRDQDDFDRFMVCFEEAKAYFFFLKWKSAAEIYHIIKNELPQTIETQIPIPQELTLPFTEADYYWCSNMIGSANPEYTITDSIVLRFYTFIN